MTARIGVVGIGWWATFNHIPTINDCPEADIVAICDLDQSRLDTAGTTFNIAARYTDVTEMMADENLDGVMISTPHIFHTDPAISALKGGSQAGASVRCAISYARWVLHCMISWLVNRCWKPPTTCSARLQAPGPTPPRPEAMLGAK